MLWALMSELQLESQSEQMWAVMSELIVSPDG
jgi:hypothetical protein